MPAKKSKITSTITPFLWFDQDAEKAAKFYTSIFDRSKITGISRYGSAGPGKPGGVMTISFNLEGQEFTALNGGPHFKFTEAVSFVVHCTTQKEVDYYWTKLSAGGTKSQCGWLKDKFGLSWQVVPDGLVDLLLQKDKEKSQRVMGAMMKMNKIVIADLQAAAAGA